MTLLACRTRLCIPAFVLPTHDDLASFARPSDCVHMARPGLALAELARDGQAASVTVQNTHVAAAAPAGGLRGRAVAFLEDLFVRHAAALVPGGARRQRKCDRKHAESAVSSEHDPVPNKTIESEMDPSIGRPVQAASLLPFHHFREGHGLIAFLIFRYLQFGRRRKSPRSPTRRTTVGVAFGARMVRLARLMRRRPRPPEQGDPR